MSPSTSETPSGRTWRGESAESRRARRRELLIEAGIERFGTQGYGNTSVKAVCEEAGLTERYFYEAFSDREGLLAAIYDQLIADALTATVAALDGAPADRRAQTEASLTAFARTVTRDPRRARIQQIEVVGVSDALEQRRRGAMHTFATLIAERGRSFRAAGAEPAGLDPAVLALGLVGGVNEQLIDFVQGRLDLTLDELVAHQVAVFEAVAELVSG
jgi:AcrR family transcriptional regulator